MTYPYIQSKKKLTNEFCESCQQTKDIVHVIEWRVDWFQGNCEFETICPECFNKRKQDKEKSEREYIKKMTPIWEKQRLKQKNKEKRCEEMIKELGLEIKKYNNGQWAIGGIIDWWTTTGTAIERKSRKQYLFSFDDLDKIKKVLQNKE